MPATTRSRSFAYSRCCCATRRRASPSHVWNSSNAASSHQPKEVALIVDPYAETDVLTPFDEGARHARRALSASGDFHGNRDGLVSTLPCAPNVPHHDEYLAG